MARIREWRWKDMRAVEAIAVEMAEEITGPYIEKISRQICVVHLSDGRNAEIRLTINADERWDE